MHLNEGEIQAYIDKALDPADQSRIQAHLASCRRCQTAADQMLAAHQQIQAKLALLNETSPASRLSPAAARSRLAARRSQITKETETMSKKWYDRMPRPAWVALIVVAVLAIALLFAPVRAIANGFLGLFRVQKIEVVQVNPGALPDQLGQSSQFESMLTQDLQFQKAGDPQEVADAATASDMAGFAVRQLQGMTDPAKFSVQPGGNATLTLNADHLRAILNEIGRTDIQVPDMLNGATISLQVPTGVLTEYGNCQFDLEKARQNGFNPDNGSLPRLPNCTTFIQMPSPTISAPPGLNVEQIGEAYLQVLGMSQDEAQRFASNVDWASTFVIPIPRYGATYQDVSVDGVTGTLIQDNPDGRKPQYLLIWVKNDMIYAITGPGSMTDALQLANSLQ
jgi:anti-sigma factor RsiW